MKNILLSAQFYLIFSSSFSFATTSVHENPDQLFVDIAKFYVKKPAIEPNSKQSCLSTADKQHWDRKYKVKGIRWKKKIWRKNASNEPTNEETDSKRLETPLDEKSKKISKVHPKENVPASVSCPLKNFLRNGLSSIFNALKCNQVTGVILTSEQKRYLYGIKVKGMNNKKIKEILNNKEGAFLKPLIIQAVNQNNGEILGRRANKTNYPEITRAIKDNRLALIEFLEKGELPKGFSGR